MMTHPGCKHSYSCEKLKSSSNLIGKFFSEPSPRSSRESAKQFYQDNLQNNNGGLSVESGFQSALLNAKLIELEKEIDHFRKENEALKTQVWSLTAIIILLALNNHCLGKSM